MPYVYDQLIQAQFEHVSSLPATGKEGSPVYLTTDKKAYYWNGTEWIPWERSTGGGGGSGASIATDAEAKAGTNRTKAITPSQLAKYSERHKQWPVKAYETANPSNLASGEIGLLTANNANITTAGAFSRVKKIRIHKSGAAGTQYITNPNYNLSNNTVTESLDALEVGGYIQLENNTNNSTQVNNNNRPGYPTAIFIVTSITSDTNTYTLGVTNIYQSINMPSSPVGYDVFVKLYPYQIDPAIQTPNIFKQILASIIGAFDTVKTATSLVTGAGKKITLAILETIIHPVKVKQFSLSGYILKPSTAPPAFGQIYRTSSTDWGASNTGLTFKPKLADADLLTSVLATGYVLEIRKDTDNWQKFTCDNVNDLGNGLIQISFSHRETKGTLADNNSVTLVSHAYHPSWQDVKDSKTGTGSHYEVASTKAISSGSGTPKGSALPATQSASGLFFLTATDGSYTAGLYYTTGNLTAKSQWVKVGGGAGGEADGAPQKTLLATSATLPTSVSGTNKTIRFWSGTNSGSNVYYDIGNWTIEPDVTDYVKNGPDSGNTARGTLQINEYGDAGMLVELEVDGVVKSSVPGNFVQHRYSLSTGNDASYNRLQLFWDNGTGYQTQSGRRDAPVTASLFGYSKSGLALPANTKIKIYRLDWPIIGPNDATEKLIGTASALDYSNASNNAVMAFTWTKASGISDYDYTSANKIVTFPAVSLDKTIFKIEIYEGTTLRKRITAGLGFVYAPYSFTGSHTGKIQVEFATSTSTGNVFRVSRRSASGTIPSNTTVRLYEVTLKGEKGDPGPAGPPGTGGGDETDSDLVDALIEADTLGDKLSRSFVDDLTITTGEATHSVDNTARYGVTDLVAIDFDSNTNFLNAVQVGDYMDVRVGTKRLIAKIAGVNNTADNTARELWHEPPIYGKGLDQYGELGSGSGTIQFSRRTVSTKKVLGASDVSGYTRASAPPLGWGSGGWGVPSKYTDDSGVGTMIALLLQKLSNHCVTNGFLGFNSPSNLVSGLLGNTIYYKKVSKGSGDSSYTGVTVCGITSSSYGSFSGTDRISSVIYYDPVLKRFRKFNINSTITGGANFQNDYTEVADYGLTKTYESTQKTTGPTERLIGTASAIQSSIHAQWSAVGFTWTKASGVTGYNYDSTLKQVGLPVDLTNKLFRVEGYHNTTFLRAVTGGYLYPLMVSGSNNVRPYLDGVAFRIDRTNGSGNATNMTVKLYEVTL